MEGKSIKNDLWRVLWQHKRLQTRWYIWPFIFALIIRLVRFRVYSIYDPSCALMRLFRSYWFVIFHSSARFAGVSIAYTCGVMCMMLSSCISQVTYCANFVRRLWWFLRIFCSVFSLLQFIFGIRLILFLFSFHVVPCIWLRCRRWHVRVCWLLEWYSRQSPASGRWLHLQVRRLSLLSMVHGNAGEQQ